MFFIILTVIPIIIGLFIRNKPIRYFFWLISIGPLSLTISTINKHSSDVDRQTSVFLGNYVIDTSKSVYKMGTLKKYQKLTLTVNSNNTFQFDDTSMFPSKNGKWKFYSTEDGGFVRCRFSNEKYETEVFAGDGLWGFQQSSFENSSTGDIIYFRKITTSKENN